MEIRQADKNDLKEIKKIEKICFPPEEAVSDKLLEERFNIFRENFLVALDDNKVIGFIDGCTTDRASLPDELYENTNLHKKDGAYQTIFELNVLPQYRNKDVAKSLLMEFIRMSKKRGKKGIILTCKDYLINYYMKFGFTHEGISRSCRGEVKLNDMLLLFDK